MQASGDRHNITSFLGFGCVTELLQAINYSCDFTMWRLVVFDAESLSLQMSRCGPCQIEKVVDQQ